MLLTSVVVFIVIPLGAGWLTRTASSGRAARNGSRGRFLPGFQPVMIAALLLTLVLIFAFQADEP